MVANMNVEKFIDDIYERPVIWNRSYSGNKPYLDETWTEMGQLHKLATVQLKAKWKGLRDMFRVEYKRIPRNESGDLTMEPYEFNSKWIFYKPLLFLVDHMRSRGSNKSSSSSSNNKSNSSPYDDDVDHSSSQQPINLTADADHDFYASDATTNDDTNEQKIVPFAALQPEVLIKTPSTTLSTASSVADTRPIKKRRRHHQHHSANLSSLSDMGDINGSNALVGGSNSGGTTTTTSILYNGGVTIGFASDIKEEPTMKIVSTPEISISAIPVPSSSTSSCSTPKVTTTSADSAVNVMSGISNGMSGGIPLPEPDSDYHFLMSLHPYMTQLNAVQKLRIRTRIQNLIFNELYDGGGTMSGGGIGGGGGPGNLIDYDGM